MPLISPLMPVPHFAASTPLLILLTANRQTDRQTDRHWRKNNLLDGGSNAITDLVAMSSHRGHLPVSVDVPDGQRAVGRGRQQQRDVLGDSQVLHLASVSRDGPSACPGHR